MVKIKYGMVYRRSIGKKGESIKADTLGELIEKIEQKYEGKESVDKIRNYALILLNNKEILKNKNLEYKLTSKDEILLMQIIGGG